MKILDSKYHEPTDYFVADRRKKFRIVSDNHKGKNFPYKQALSETLNNISLDECDIVINQEKLNKLVKCTDFTYLDFSKSANRLYEAEMCYFHPQLQVFITITQDLSNDYDAQLFEQDMFKVANIFYDGRQDNVKEAVDTFFSEYLEKYMLGEKIAILVKESDYFELKTHKIKPLPLDLNTMYNPDFQSVHSRIHKSLNNSNKGIVLLHGVAGTGKTNYIKWLITQTPNKKFIFVPTTIIHQLTDPSFLSVLLQNKNSVLVLEDCENYIAERHAQNANTDVVASILNLADGLLSDVVECQIICTFNAQIDKIDTALLRKGRLIAEYQFKQLNVDTANSYLASVGKDTQVKDEIILADLIHDKAAYRSKEETKTIGFI